MGTVGSEGSRPSRRERLLAELAEDGVVLIDDHVLRGDVTDEYEHLSEADAEVLQEVLLDELLYSRRPLIHERRVPSYGCIVTAWPLPSEDELPAGLTLVDREGIKDMAAARELCDGRRTFLLRPADGTPASLAVVAADDELSLVRLAADTPAWIIQRHQDGSVRLFGREHVHTNQFDRWTRRPYAPSRTLQLAHAVDADEQAVLAGGSLLELALHLLSPRGIGATFIWYPQADPGGSEPFTHAPRPLASRLSVREPLHADALAAVLAMTDGATVVDREGVVRGVGAFVRPSDLAVEVVKQPPGRGARHISAARFSFDVPASVVVVVSSDGPVTVYSDGIDILRLDEYGAYPAPLSAAFPEVRERLQEWRDNFACGRCRKPIVADLAEVDGWNETRAVSCPVCGETLVEARYTFVSVRVTKPWAGASASAQWGMASAATVGYAVDQGLA